MKMGTPNDDILTVAERRRTTTGATSSQRSDRSKLFPSEHIFMIDNYTGGGSGISTPSPAPSPLTSPILPKSISKKRVQPKGFIAEIKGERARRGTPRVPIPIFLEDAPYSRNILPPFIPIEIQDEEVPALVHTASHISLISKKLVHKLGLSKEVLPDTSVPPSPINASSSIIHWRIEGKIRYVELTLKGIKHVAQLYVAQELPTELVLGVDFLKKVQGRINFEESSFSFPASRDTKVSFLSSKDLGQRSLANQKESSAFDFRATSSNF